MALLQVKGLISMIVLFYCNLRLQSPSVSLDLLLCLNSSKQHYMPNRIRHTTQVKPMLSKCLILDKTSILHYLSKRTLLLCIVKCYC